MIQVNLKKDLIEAVVLGDKNKFKRLARLIKIGADNEMPLFIDIERKEGKVFIGWKGLVLTESDFDQLKEDVPQVVFWEEIKTYAE